MKKPLISFDSPRDPDLLICDACKHFDVMGGCELDKEPWECEEWFKASGEKLRELIREEKS